MSYMMRMKRKSKDKFLGTQTAITEFGKKKPS